MRRIMMLVAVLAAGAVHAEDAEAAKAVPFGVATRSWTDLQAGGSAASSEARPLPGDAAKNVYERYANSFKQPIPDKFDRESFATKAN